MPAFDTPSQMIPPADLRQALSQFPTGVTIVTCDSMAGPVGITANSFNSVSLDPALVLWSISKTSRRYDFFATAKHFAIHVLSTQQVDLCRAFAKDAHAFSDAPWGRNDHNVPILANCAARFECETFALHEGGDHSIIIGQVHQLDVNPHKPLIFSQGEMVTK